MKRKLEKALPVTKEEIHEIVDWQLLKLFFMNHKETKKLTLVISKKPRTISIKWRV